jgi:hypothetical protein
MNLTQTTERKKIHAIYELRRRNRREARVSTSQPPSRESLIEHVMERLDAFHAAYEARRLHNSFHRKPPAVAEAELAQLKRDCATRLVDALAVLSKPRED